MARMLLTPTQTPIHSTSEDPAAPPEELDSSEYFQGSTSRLIARASGLLATNRTMPASK